MTSERRDVTTIVELLADRAYRQGHETYLNYLPTGDASGPRMIFTFAQIAQRAWAIAARLEALKLHGQRVILLQPPGPAFLEAILGCFCAGVVAVPVPLPDPARLGRALVRLRAIIDNASAAAVLTSEELAALLPAFAADVGLDQLPIVRSDAIADDEASGWSKRPPAAEALAMLQYTSGSTGTPRGVALTHRNLATNLAAITAASGSKGGVSWLPPYHDMGLIGGMFWPLGSGFSVTTFSPLLFLQRPLRWLEAISAFEAEITVAPNFALSLVTKHATDEDVRRLNLSALRVCWCGSEPVRAEALKRFEARFAASGLRPAVIRPCYGLAEATLMVSRVGHSGAQLISVDATALSHGELRRSSQTDARVLVGNGALVPDTEVRIVDPQTRLDCPAGLVGELWVRGPGVASGYFGREADTQETFFAQLASGEGPFLRTGDLGLLDDEAGVIICGRLKDVIIVRGRNLYPDDLEATLAQVDPAVRPGCAAAFPVIKDGEERVGICVEVSPNRQPAAGWADLCTRLRGALLETHEVRPALLALLAPGELPKTTSGKVQRRATREALAAGKLAVLAQEESGAESIYEGLANHVARIDARSTKYRFDLEKDIDWGAIDAPGAFFPPEFARTMLGEEYEIACAAGVWKDVEWLLAMALCRLIWRIETVLVEFLGHEVKELGARRSMNLLHEEEDKHIALFQRLDKLLQERRPELARALEPRWREIEADYLRLHTPEHFPSKATWHFAILSGTLFFECWSQWIAEALAAERELVQPLWLSANLAHAREEVQHVVTGRAWLDCHVLGASEHDPWLRNTLTRALTWPISMLQAALQAARDFHPQLPSDIRIGAANIIRLLPTRSFRACREQFAFFAELATFSHGEQGVLQTSVQADAPVRSQEALLSFIQTFIAHRNDNRAQSVPADTTFARLGLDSADHVGLASALGGFLQTRVSEVAAYSYPTPALLAEALSRRPQPQSSAAPATGEDLASARQTRLVLLDAARGGEATLDHLTTAYWIEGVVDPGVLRVALRDVIQRHEALRTTFSHTGERVQQQVHASVEIDLHESLVEDARSAAQAMAEHFDTQPYALSTGPLLRAALVRDADRAALVIGLHHLCGDGWSLAVLMADLAATYWSRLAGNAPSLGTLSLTPRQLAAEEAALLGSPEGAQRRSWWMARLAGHPLLARPGPRARFDGRAVWRQINLVRRTAWTRWATARQDTLAGALLAALHLALFRRHGDLDVLVCAHHHDRTREARRGLVGYLVNLLPLRTDLTGLSDLGDALLRVRRTWVEAMARELPIDALLRELVPAQYTTRFMPSPLAFNYIPVADETLRGVQATLRYAPELLPDPSFLFFAQMLVARPVREGLVLGAWMEAPLLAQTASLLDEMSAILDAAAGISS